MNCRMEFHVLFLLNYKGKSLADVTTLHLITLERQPNKRAFLIRIYGFCVPKELKEKLSVEFSSIMVNMYFQFL